MDAPSPAPNEIPYEPPRSAIPVPDGKVERRPLRWQHWLAFFSPAMAGVSYVAMGVGSQTPLERLGIGLILGILLCWINGMWLWRFGRYGNHQLNGCFWVTWGLIANAAVAVAGFFVLR